MSTAVNENWIKLEPVSSSEYKIVYGTTDATLRDTYTFKLRVHLQDVDTVYNDTATINLTFNEQTSNLEMIDHVYTVGQGVYEIEVPALSFLPALEDMVDESAPLYTV